MNVFVTAFPAASVAVHDTVVRPIGNVEPDAGVHTVVTAMPATPTADVENVTTAPSGPVAFTVRSAGTVNAGAVAFATVSRMSRDDDPTISARAPRASVQACVVVDQYERPRLAMCIVRRCASPGASETRSKPTSDLTASGTGGDADGPM